jgi:integral membrane protein
MKRIRTIKERLSNSEIIALRAYQILAIAVGIGLATLVFVGIPLQIWAHNLGVVKIVGPIHGFLYIIYLIAAANLWRKTKLSILKLLAIIAAGFVPLAAFFVEYWITKTLHPRR